MADPAASFSDQAARLRVAAVVAPVLAVVVVAVGLAIALPVAYASPLAVGTLVVAAVLGVAAGLALVQGPIARHRDEIERRDNRQLALTADLRSLDEQLASADRRHDALVGEAAEQLREPLRVITEQLGELEGIEQEGARPQLVTASREVRRLSRLSGDLTTLARAQRGQVELEPSEVELRALVGEVADRLRPQVEAAGGRLLLLPGGRVVLQADRRRIAQVLVNLLGNALLACAERPQPEIMVGLSRTTVDGRPVARITVTDNGVGLPPQECEAVFERFHRAPGTRPGPGAGLGLTIARSVVRAHHGELAISSPGPGRGATATLTLPLTSSRTGASSHPGDPADESSRSCVSTLDEEPSPISRDAT